jgi:alkylhydroperoxidase family enzyme
MTWLAGGSEGDPGPGRLARAPGGDPEPDVLVNASEGEGERGRASGGGREWDRLAGVHPEAFAALAGLVAAAWAECDPVLLELARLRTATLLRYHAELERRTARARTAGLTEAKVAELAAWPSSPRFSPCERVCLALTEQFVIDANGVTDALVAAVTEHLGPEGCYTFVQAVSVLETFQRACLTLGIETAPDVDELAAMGAAPTTPEEPR